MLVNGCCAAPVCAAAAALVMPGTGGATYRLATLADDAALAAVAGTATAAASSASRADPVAAVARPVRDLLTRDMLILHGTRQMGTGRHRTAAADARRRADAAAGVVISE